MNWAPCSLARVFRRPFWSLCSVKCCVSSGDTRRSRTPPHLEQRSRSRSHTRKVERRPLVPRNKAAPEGVVGLQEEHSSVGTWARVVWGLENLGSFCGRWSWWGWLVAALRLTGSVSWGWWESLKWIIAVRCPFASWIKPREISFWGRKEGVITCRIAVDHRGKGGVFYPISARNPAELWSHSLEVVPKKCTELPFLSWPWGIQNPRC